MSEAIILHPPEIPGLIIQKDKLDSLVLVGHEADTRALVWQRPDDWYLQLIFVMPARRGQGLASQMLTLICAAADAQQKVIALSIEAIGFGGLSNKALGSWYRRHGFKQYADCEAGYLLRYPKKSRTY